MNDQPHTPEEAKWEASVLDPQRAKRRIKYSYILLTIWIAFFIGWTITEIRSDEPLGWSDGLLAVVILMGCMSALTGLINNRRIARGRKPIRF